MLESKQTVGLEECVTMIFNFLSALREVEIDPFLTLKMAPHSSDQNRIGLIKEERH